MLRKEEPHIPGIFEQGSSSEQESRRGRVPMDDPRHLPCLRQCEKIKAGGGSSGGKGKGTGGARFHGPGARASGAKARANGQHPQGLRLEREMSKEEQFSRVVKQMGKAQQDQPAHPPKEALRIQWRLSHSPSYLVS